MLDTGASVFHIKRSLKLIARFTIKSNLLYELELFTRTARPLERLHAVSA